jgi:hypothetical protein
MFTHPATPLEKMQPGRQIPDADANGRAMHPSRPLSLPILLLTVLAASACDPDADLALALELSEEAALADDELDAPVTEFDSPAAEFDSLEPNGAGNQQTVSTCNLGLPDSVIHQLFRIGKAHGSLSGITSGNYSLNVTPSLNNPSPIQIWWLSVDGNGISTSAYSSPPTFAADDGDALEFQMMAFNWAQVGWVYEFQIDLYSEPGHQLLCSDTTSMEVQPDCDEVDYWSTNPWPHPWYDGANCFVATLPGGVTPFVWGNSWYVQPGPGNQCAIGVFDSANCYIGSAPWGQQAFIWGNSMYYEQ